MRTFFFEGLDTNGKQVTGTTQASNEVDAVRQIRESGYYPTYIGTKPNPSSLVQVDAPLTWGRATRPTASTNAEQLDQTKKDRVPYSSKTNWWQRYRERCRAREKEDDRRMSEDPEYAASNIAASVFSILSLVAAMILGVPKQGGVYTIVGVAFLIGFFFGKAAYRLRKDTQASVGIIAASVIFSIAALPFGLILAFCALSSPANRFLGIGLLLVSLFASAVSLALYVLF